MTISAGRNRNSVKALPKIYFEDVFVLWNVDRKDGENVIVLGTGIMQG